MINRQNSFEIQDLSLLQHKAGAKISSSIQNASAKTGVDFSYLLQQAKVESGFKADAKAKTSSATGLYQFIESTWLSMVKEHGDKYGLQNYASKISDNGRVENPSLRREILNLRKDPQIASLMAAEYARANQEHLQNKVGGEIGSTELYLAHFMGPGGASKFLDAYRDSPHKNAAAIFPTEARANRNVFFDRDGSARSLKEVYAFFDKKFEGDKISNSVELAQMNEKMPMRPVPSRVDFFDEQSGQWVKTSKPQHIEQTLALLDSQNSWDKNKGGLPLFGNLLTNQIDLMTVAALTDTAPEERRYNS